MDPTLIIFGIRTILRLAQEGTATFKQYQRDRPALFPDAIEADFRKIDCICDTFIPNHIDQITGDGPLAKFWGDLVPDPNVPNATEVLYMAAVRLRAEMAAAGIHIVEPRELKPAEREWLDRLFVAQYLPILTPLAVDPAHPFPFIQNGGITVGVELRRERDGTTMHALIPIPMQLVRFIRLPVEPTAAGEDVPRLWLQ